jgi:hypothetical protein
METVVVIGIVAASVLYLIRDFKKSFKSSIKGQAACPGCKSQKDGACSALLKHRAKD